LGDRDQVEVPSCLAQQLTTKYRVCVCVSSNNNKTKPEFPIKKTHKQDVKNKKGNQGRESFGYKRSGFLATKGL